jgi:hypothetical protein
MPRKTIGEISFAKTYPYYVAKVEKKGRSVEELEQVISWLTGYAPADIESHIAADSTFQAFFDKAPRFNPDAHLITGVICGIRVEDIEDPLTQKARYLDKLIDELAKGKAMEKILRS